MDEKSGVLSGCGSDVAGVGVVGGTPRKAFSTFLQDFATACVVRDGRMTRSRSSPNCEELERNNTMKELNRPLPTNSTRPALNTLSKLAAMVCFVLGLAGAMPLCSAGSVSARGHLKPRDIVIADSNGAILKFDPVSGEVSLLCAGYPFSQPYGIALDNKGNVLVTDTGLRAVIRMNPATGTSEIVAGNVPGLPFGIAVDAQGDILVANAAAILRIKPDTGAISVVSSAGWLKAPLGVALSSDGSIFVADGSGSVVKVHPVSGAQSLVSSGQYLRQPVGIAVDAGENILIADSVARRVVQVNALTGVQTVITEGGNLTTPVCVATDKRGALLISDPDAFNLAGGIIRLDRADAAQSALLQGSGNFVNPRGIAVFHPGKPTAGSEH